MENRSVPMVLNQNFILEIKLVRLELIELNLIPRSFSSCLLFSYLKFSSVLLCKYLI